jgi:hypothetical protein
MRHGLHGRGCGGREASGRQCVLSIHPGGATLSWQEGRPASATSARSSLGALLRCGPLHRRGVAERGWRYTSSLCARWCAPPLQRGGAWRSSLRAAAPPQPQSRRCAACTRLRCPVVLTAARESHVSTSVAQRADDARLCCLVARSHLRSSCSSSSSHRLPGAKRRARCLRALRSSCIAFRVLTLLAHSQTADAAMAASSGVDFSEVVELAAVTCDMMRKAHYARAERKLAQALAAAQALGQPDCLVVAFLQIELHEAAMQAHFAAQYKDLHGPPPNTVVDFALFGAACATLQRRLDAGTLLPGTCRPYEEAWHEAYARRIAVPLTPTTCVTAAPRAHRLPCSLRAFDAPAAAAGNAAWWVVTRSFTPP